MKYENDTNTAIRAHDQASERADNFAQKTKSGLSDTNRAAEQLQDANAESGMDYAGSRI